MTPPSLATYMRRYGFRSDRLIHTFLYHIWSRDAIRMAASGVFSSGKGYGSFGVFLLLNRSVVVMATEPSTYMCAEFRPSGVRSLGLRRGSEAHTLG